MMQQRVDGKRYLHVTLTSRRLDARRQAHNGNDRVTPNEPHSNTRARLLDQERRPMTKRDHLAEHTINADALLVDKPKGADRVCERRGPAESLGQYVVLVHTTDKSAGRDNRERGVRFDPGYGRRLMKVPVTVHYAVEYCLASGARWE